jgi:predicted amidophosphoribosyltransferase
MQDDHTTPLPAAPTSAGHFDALVIGAGFSGMYQLLRLRDTPAQANLGLAERRRNLEGCFACGGRLDGAHVGLVDDVMTSGSTLAEAARTLRAAGAVRVVALVAARTP